MGKDSKYGETVRTVMGAHLRAAIGNAYGELYELGYAGYPGTSQTLNIEGDPFAHAAESVTDTVLEALSSEGLRPEVDDKKPGCMTQVPASWVPVIDEDLQQAYYDVKRMLTGQDIAGRLNQYFMDGNMADISKEEFDSLVESMDDAIDEFGYSNVSDILHDELRGRNLLV